ncbi:metal-dependent hydrolase [Phosphitispora fastidiosa]|uniref:metal-dependent hydrolase n=1 Tax=Phosphitispora fastidiosa TaxID=2837202 RepID=UPI001E3EA4AB|nr:metal-dependent hydrolase [Phosphitispora fastidiosa]MBU7008367.1 L-ascorbate metabolism protein UlaG (beta-lactamase superfamily) [Phosphitispora fastidiosa]
MIIEFLGHACFMLKTEKTAMIIDPYLRDNPQASAKPDDIRTDWVLVTHGHSDHLGDAVEIARNNDATVVTITEVARYCEQRGAKTHAMYIGGKYNFGEFTIKMTLALHGSSIGVNPIEYLGQPCGFLIFIEGRTIYYSGDTGLFGDMELIGRLHPIDLAILPIGDNYTMGPEDALEAVKLLQPKQVIPAHYNTWDIISQDPEKFKAAVDLETKVPVTILHPGDSLRY